MKLNTVLIAFLSAITGFCASSCTKSADQPDCTRYQDAPGCTQPESTPVPSPAAGAPVPQVPDYSKLYFTGLNRSAVLQTDVSGNGPVILIVVDALRPDRLGAYGFKRNTSPQLDKLANEGLIFTNYFVNSNWTRPTTASMLTGLMPSTHGLESGTRGLPDDVPTLPEVLSKKGIPTGAVVGNGNGGSAFGLNRGFDFYADTVKHWKGLPNAQEVVDLAIPFVEANQKKNFFLMLFLVDPHDPYHAPGEFEDMFVQQPNVELIRTPHWELGRYTQAQNQRMLDTYDGAVRYTDTVLGGFFDKLKSLGLYDKSSIIVTADHGEAFGEHGVYLHSHHFYEELIRVPLMVRTPQMSTRGNYNHYLFESLDLAPSILSLFGIEDDETFSGENIFSVLRNPSQLVVDRAIISEFNNFGIYRRAIRTYGEKIIFQERANEAEFLATVGNKALLPSVSFDKEVIEYFDLSQDPFEKRPLKTIPDKKSERWGALLERVRVHRAASLRLNKGQKVSQIDAETAKDLKAMGYIQ